MTPKQASEDECLLAELQENNARKELTGAERKAFAAEVGRLILKLSKNSQSGDVPNGNDRWLLELGDKSGMGKSSVYRWWGDFCKSAGLDMTPKQAGAALVRDTIMRLLAELQENNARKELTGAESKAFCGRSGKDLSKVAGKV